MKVMLDDVGRGWCEWKCRDVDMRGASCHGHPKVPHKRGRIIHNCQKILHNLRSLFQVYVTITICRIRLYDAHTFVSGWSDRNHVIRDDNAGKATLSLLLILSTSSQNRIFVPNRDRSFANRSCSKAICSKWLFQKTQEYDRAGGMCLEIRKLRSKTSLFARYDDSSSQMLNLSFPSIKLRQECTN